MLHGGSLTKVKNLNDVFRRAANTMLAKIDPPETMRRELLDDEIHDEIYDYSCQSDLKREQVADLFPQVGRTRADNPSLRFVKTFDLYKSNNSFTISYDSGVKSLRFSKDTAYPRKVLHNLNSITSNGAWAADGTDASNLTADTKNKAQGSASFNFDLLGVGTTGYIENSTLTAVDLSDEEDQSKVFVWVYIPDTSIITNFILYWGSSSTAYWSATVTSPHDTSSFKTGWNLLAFDWNGATETGSPSSSAVDYLRLTVTYDGTAETDLRVDEISCSRGELFEIVYYSDCMFRTSAGVWQTHTSADSDILNVDEDGFQIYVLECLIAIAQQLQGTDSSFDVNWAKNELGNMFDDGLYAQYRRSHPSQSLKQQEFYN